MLSKNQSKIIKSLKAKKFRQKYDLFAAEGEKILQTLLTSNNFEIDTIYHTSPELNSSFNTTGINTILIDQNAMKSISFLSTPSTVFTLIKLPNKSVIMWQKAIYLDGVQDPGNVGTIIRLADWYGVDTVIRSSDSADFYSPKVIQSTMGAFANINLIEMDREELLRIDTQLIAADMSGTTLRDANTEDNFTLIMGSEGQGLHSIFQNDNVKKVTIPGAPKRISESLNVGVATAVILNQLCG